MKKFNNQAIITACIVIGALILLLLFFVPRWTGKKEEKKRIEPAPLMTQKEERATSTPSTHIPSVAVHTPEPGDPIVLMNGTPVVTTGDVEKEKEKLIEANPQLKMVIDFMDPTEVNSNIAYGLLQQFLIDKYVEEQKIPERSAYQEELSQGLVSVQRMLNAKYFRDSVPVSVSDAEVRKFYNEHKDSIQGVLITRGGTQTTGISFTQESDAQEFLLAAKTNGSVQKAAETQGITDRIHDFKLISSTSAGVDEKIKAAVLALPSVPTIELVPSNTGEFWVVEATLKKEPEYRPYDQVRADVKGLVEKQKQQVAEMELLESLQTKYNVTVNEAYLRPALEMQQEMAQMPDEFPDLLDMPELPEEIAEGIHEHGASTIA